MRLTRTALFLAALFLVATPVASATPAEPAGEQVPAQTARGERRPATPDELERYAEREQKNAELEEFEGGRRGGSAIPVTTVIVVLLIVILVVIIV
jgi:Flp pilus assembly protein TadB